MKHRKLLCSLMAIGLSLTTLPMLAATTIKASTWYPPKHPGVTGGYVPFMDYVKEKSGGDMDFKYWEGGALLGATETLPGLENGLADVGSLAMTYFPAEFPYFMLISDLAMLTDNSPATAAAIAEFITLECEPCRDEFFDKGLVYTSGFAITPYTLISKEPIESPADLKGKKFRSPGTLWDRWVNYVGGTPINMPASEMFESLDRGGIDIVTFSPAALSAYSLWDVASYDTLLPVGIYAALSTFTMNQDFWQDLSDDQRRILLDASAVGAMGATFRYIEDDEKTKSEAADHGVEIAEPSDALIEQLEEFKAHDLDKVKQLAKERYHIDNAEELIGIYSDLIKKWEKITDEADGDKDAIIQAMQDEIYAKIDVSEYGM